MVGLIVGFILGTIGSLIAWFVTAGFLTPKIEIRDFIEARYFPDSIIKYRFGVRNRRIFRDAQDVTIRIRCAFRPHDRRDHAGPARITFALPVDDEWVPVIRSRWYWRKHTSKSMKIFWPELPRVLADQLPPWVAKQLPSNARGEIDLPKFLAPENQGTIRLIIIAYDSWSGTKKVFVRRFDQANIREEVIATHDVSDPEGFIPGYS